MKSRPHTTHVGRPVLVDDERRRVVPQRDHLLAVEVGAAVGGVHLEPRVERGDRDVALRRCRDLRSPRVRPRRRVARCRRRSWRVTTWCRATSVPCSTRCAPRRGARTWCRRQAARRHEAPGRLPHALVGLAPSGAGVGRARRRWCEASGSAGRSGAAVVGLRWWSSLTVSCTLIALGVAAGRWRVVRVPPAFDGVDDAVAAVVADPLDRCAPRGCRCPAVARSRRTTLRPG